ncbi:uncharacterized protein F4807DRAFT_438339 [Annulohypoxylon truncatum]|uniref:uncharacterized protein n=1 Tax=Annulohypoxylon truncatum TaxID=327061 RepID=UPI0020076D8F|nr:uncharacterized protein F4807DRAFT_438339 [Annulohypoxylon truncatum]KAI1206533.1 hypothetical protein F4807DRAFT_438339 [Annulohypoxylon truncatum]
MVQDEEGETERLDLCLHNSKYEEDILESASSFVVKEPYFTLTDQGEATIRVDHPSDLIVYRNKTTNGDFSSVKELKGQAKDAATAERIAKAFKDEGNTALRRQNLPLAHAMYTDGIGVARQDALSATNPDLARDLHRNRAHVNLLLSRLDEAKLDAKAALIEKEDQASKDLDSKAYFRAGCAAYDLGEYQEATVLFENQRKLKPANKSATVYLKKIEERLREQETGRYNFKQIKAALSRSRPRVDAADFIVNTKIGESPGKGRGLFATKDIATGELVMCEKAFCVVWGHDKEALTAVTYDSRDDRIRISPVGLRKSIVQKLLSNDSQIEKVMDLYGDYQGDGSESFRTEDGPIVDTFRVHDIVSRNAFSPGSQFGEEDASNASTGLWVRAAYINHSCVANIEKEYVGDMMILRASRPIKSGEEIFHRYDESSDYEARQRALETTWGFGCSCALCVVEKADDPALRKRRQELVNEADQLIAKEHWANARSLMVTRAKRIMRSIDETYQEKKYKGLPHLATRRIQEWISLASPRR